MTDFAKRAYDHSYRLDPIVRSLLDLDFYKLLMLQFIWMHYSDVPVTFAMKNRSTRVDLTQCVNMDELRDQLNHVKTLRFTNSELIWLQGNTFYGTQNLFQPEFIDFLRTLDLSQVEISYRYSGTNTLELEFSGPWAHVTLWEIFCLSIVNELRNRSELNRMSRFELDILYSKAKSKLWDKFSQLAPLEDLNLTDFGTRRRHSFLWQEWAVLAASDALGKGFTGTSNTYLAYKHGFEAKGTNAHELPMVLATLAQNDQELLESQYKVLIKWEDTYSGSLLVALPDTFGTTQFLKRAPSFLKSWTGFRFDSKDNVTAGREAIAWWRSQGVDPKTKLGLFSDGLDVEDIVALHGEFHNQMRVGFGWGTTFSNDFVGCHPRGNDAALAPISLVCKVKTANARSAVKLSDNFVKASGSAEEIARYRGVFGTEGVANVPVRV